MSFTQFNLHPTIVQAIEKAGFNAPTAIQKEAIPIILEGRDLMASAHTGTGKTAAFVLPAVQRLLSNVPGAGQGPRVLILTPTRELAMQVNDIVRQFASGCRLRHGAVVGGMPYPPQQRLLSQALDILVATPGRLMDHMARGRVDFSRLEMLVLDEADRMLDMGFVDAVKEIAAATPKRRQSLLFSATLEGKVLSMARQLLREPARVQLATNRVHNESIAQCMHRVDNATHKHELLEHYLQTHDLQQAIIFTATKRGADQLARELATQGHASAALHGDMSQAQRKRTVEKMRRRKVRCLVATDVAARGLDIRGVSHVINFDLPMVAEDYIHRIGRTGRGGETGRAISLVAKSDWRKLAGIERLTGRKLSREVVPGLEPSGKEPAGPEARASRKPPNKGRRNRDRVSSNRVAGKHRERRSAAGL